MDGARIWEAQPFYDRRHADIAGLADTVYTLLYKGLEGVRGAVLAGLEDLVAEAESWRRRLSRSDPGRLAARSRRADRARVGTRPGARVPRPRGRHRRRADRGRHGHDPTRPATEPAQIHATARELVRPYSTATTSSPRS
ncbi:hypothetical protein [Actinophytocola sp.]|uniref:hypothetical protein n=1 Tax=Actinophytocola sp. TaxID=1872138 RepID=UPI003D6AB425